MFVMTAIDICTEAIRIVARLGSTTSGIDDPLQLDIAMRWLNMIVGQLVGTQRMFGFMPSNTTITVTADTGSYNLAPGPLLPEQDDLTIDQTDITADGLASLAGTDNSAVIPDQGFQFPVRITPYKAGKVESQHLASLSRREWEDVEDKTKSGDPTCYFLDYHSVDSPTLHIYPVPNVSGWTLQLTMQTFAPEMTREGDDAMQLRTAWNRWAVFQLSADLGSGPLELRPKVERDSWQAAADRAKADLNAFENREHVALPQRQVAYNAVP